MAKRSGKAPQLSAETIRKARAVLDPPKKVKAGQAYSPPQAALPRKGGVPQLRVGALTGTSFNAKHRRNAITGKFVPK